MIFHQRWKHESYHIHLYLVSVWFFLQSRNQTAIHLVASRQTGTATAILRALLQAAGKDIRLKVDGVSLLGFSSVFIFYKSKIKQCSIGNVYKSVSIK